MRARARTFACTSIRIARRRAGSRDWPTTASSRSRSIWAAARCHNAAGDASPETHRCAGTIPIEAVHLARATPRRVPTLGALGLAAASPPLWPDAAPLVVGCDIDLDVLASARDNARAAQLDGAITWQRCDVADLRPDTIAQIALERGREPTTGVLLANPPYGERLDVADLERVYGA